MSASPIQFRILRLAGFAGLACLGSCSDGSKAEAWIDESLAKLESERVTAELQNESAAAALDAFREWLPHRREEIAAERKDRMSWHDSSRRPWDFPSTDLRPSMDGMRDCLANVLVLRVDTERFDRIEDVEAELEAGLAGLLERESLLIGKWHFAIRLVAGNAYTESTRFSDLSERLCPTREQAWGDRGPIPDDWHETFSWTNDLFRPRNLVRRWEGCSGSLMAAQIAEAGEWRVLLDVKVNELAEPQKLSFETGLPAGEGETTYWVEKPAFAEFEVRVESRVEPNRWAFLASAPSPTTPETTHVVLLNVSAP